MFIPIALSFITAALASIQEPLQHPSHGDAAFNVFQSEVSPEYSIRLKEQNSSICNTSVVQYTGYLDAGNKHFFFWYFAQEESVDTVVQASADALPLALWLNGGPGASTMLGLLQELGPCLINNFGNGTVNNPYAWNKDSAILFVDQPIGVGFSYYDGDDLDEPPSDSFASAVDMQLFIQLFVTKVVPSHRQGDFVLTGESYAVSNTSRVCSSS